MSVFKNIAGTMKSFFQFGGPDGAAIKENSGVLENRNAADTAFATGRVANIATGAGLNDIAALRDLQAANPNITFSFDGADVGVGINPGDNTAKFGFLHTTGGAFTQGQVVYDTGTVLEVMPAEVTRKLTTTAAVTGGVSLIANGSYALESGSWVLKGDGSTSNTGAVKCIKAPYSFADGTIDSTTAIPDGAESVRVSNRVDTGFDGSSPTLQVTVNGSSPLTIMGTSDSNLKKANQYDNEDIQDIGATEAGVVRLLVVPDSSTVGSGVVNIFYTVPVV